MLNETRLYGFWRRYTRFWYSNGCGRSKRDRPKRIKSNAIQATGVIAKIDPQSRTITVSDFALSSNSPEPTGSPNAPADQTNADSAKTTKVLKYSEHTNFASTNPEQMNGRMSDLQVGDSVSLQVDNQNSILRIEEISSPPQNQQ